MKDALNILGILDIISNGHTFIKIAVTLFYNYCITYTLYNDVRDRGVVELCGTFLYMYMIQGNC